MYLKRLLLGLLLIVFVAIVVGPNLVDEHRLSRSRSGGDRDAVVRSLGRPDRVIIAPLPTVLRAAECDDGAINSAMLYYRGWRKSLVFYLDADNHVRCSARLALSEGFTP
jgi:hypothetical protein